jgi:hypothetical protein
MVSGLLNLAIDWRETTSLLSVSSQLLMVDLMSLGRFTSRRGRGGLESIPHGHRCSLIDFRKNRRREPGLLSHPDAPKDTARWQGSCEGQTKAAGLCQSRAFGARGMKLQRHFGNTSDLALREVTRISALICDIDRVVRIFDRDIANEEDLARVYDPSDPTYPMLARTLTARRDNLKETIAALERRLADLPDNETGGPIQRRLVRREECDRRGRQKLE